MESYRHAVGRFGENLAVNFLRGKGYKIIETNIKDSYYEIDIIAKTIIKTVFIEVKTRTSQTLGYADESMTRQKLNCLKKAVLAYSSKHNIDLNYIRVDLIAIDLDRINKIAKIKHYRDII